MELHQIRYMCAVAETGSFTRAAAREHVAQPSLSQQIIKLEGELGARLFDRLGRKIRLTQFGETFYRRATEILRNVDTARAEVQELAGTARGTVRVGAIPTISPYLLPKALPAFSKKFPRVDVIVSEEITPLLLQKLHEGALDIAIVALPIQGHEFITEEIIREPLYVATSSKTRLRHSSAPMKDLAEQPFLLLKEGHCFRDSAITACKQAKFTPNVVFESGQFASILGMVAAGVGISMVPEMALEPRRGCRFLRIKDSRAIRRIGLVRLRNHFFSRPQREFAAHLAALGKIYERNRI
jgi:LysR family transcriptional regulator, hydrogen peroxide-inducible genes activator